MDFILLFLRFVFSVWFSQGLPSKNTASFTRALSDSTSELEAESWCSAPCRLHSICDQRDLCHLVEEKLQQVDQIRVSMSKKAVQLVQRTPPRVAEAELQNSVSKQISGTAQNRQASFRRRKLEAPRRL